MYNVVLCISVLVFGALAFLVKQLVEQSQGNVINRLSWKKAVENVLQIILFIFISFYLVKWSDRKWDMIQISILLIFAVGLWLIFRFIFSYYRNPAKGSADIKEEKRERKPVFWKRIDAVYLEYMEYAVGKLCSYLVFASAAINLALSAVTRPLTAEEGNLLYTFGGGRFMVTSMEFKGLLNFLDECMLIFSLLGIATSIHNLILILTKKGDGEVRPNKLLKGINDKLTHSEKRI